MKTLLILLLSTTFAFADPIGKTTITRNQVQGIINNNTRNLQQNDDVFEKENIKTGLDSRTDMRFNDSSNLTVGPSSEIRLDSFVYNPKKSGQFIKGSFRFVTGSHKEYKIKTPYGTLGVRG